MYDGIIFDKDGVLLDSGINNFRWMDQVRTEAAKQKGFSFTAEDSYRLVHAESAEQVEHLINDKGMTWEELRDIEEKVQSKKKELMKYGIITLFPNVKTLLENIDQEKALVSNAPRNVTEFTLEYFGIEQHFSKVNATSVENPKLYYKRKKPKPVMLKEVIEELEFNNPLMIGDTSADILAAKNAGIDAIHVNSYDFDPKADPKYQVPRVEQVEKIIKNS